MADNPQERAIVEIRMPSAPTASTIKAVQDLALAACKSGMSKAKNPADAFFICMYGMELGIPPMTALRTIYSVKGGAPTCSGEAMLSLLRKSGKVRISIPDPATVKDKATIQIERLDTGERGEYTFTMDMARRANLVKSEGNWTHYPHMMLIWRAVSMGAKLLCSDIIGGLYTVEEIYPDTPVDETGTPVADIVTDMPPNGSWSMHNLEDATTFLYDNPAHQDNSLDKLFRDGLLSDTMSLRAAVAAVLFHRAETDYNLDATSVGGILVMADSCVPETASERNLMPYQAWVACGHTPEEAWAEVLAYVESRDLPKAKPKRKNEPVIEGDPIADLDDEFSVPRDFMGATPDQDVFDLVS